MIITINVKNEIVREAIGSAGSGYWCDLRDERHKWSASKMELTIVETGDGDPKVHKLTRADFERGVAVLAEKFPHKFAELIEQNGDMYTGDLLVQCALFGEEKYA